MRRKTNCRSIMCINDGLIYDSIMSAAEFYQTSHSTISKQLMGIRPAAAGRYFVYVDEMLSESDLFEIRKRKILEIYNLSNITIS